jgi:hypothetical protein
MYCFTVGIASAVVGIEASERRQTKSLENEVQRIDNKFTKRTNEIGGDIGRLHKSVTDIINVLNPKK